MKFETDIQNKIQSIWEQFVSDGRKGIDLKGNEYQSRELDQNRIAEIKVLKGIIDDFINRKIDFKSFKSTLDGENKRNNLWGFPAIKGQMFFNQLTNSQPDDLEPLRNLLSKCISEPSDIEDAKEKIQSLEKFVLKIYNEADDKRKVPKPSSIPYFLSYFWQIHNYSKWPIYYTSLINSLRDLGLWKQLKSENESYEYFYSITNKIKDYLESYSKEQLTHWDVEHCFWWSQQKKKNSATKRGGKTMSFELNEYIPPIISNLVEKGQQKGESRTSKGIEFEKQVSLGFKMLDFDVEELGQGRGREPDSIVTDRPENTVFIVDAKVRPEGYSIGVDDRAIKEYINKHLPKLKKEGYKKTGFIIVSSKFKGDPNKFVDDITLETEIKRLTLLTSEALLYLVAFKLKDGRRTTDIENVLLQNGIVDAKSVIELFGDV